MARDARPYVRMKKTERYRDFDAHHVATAQ